MLRLLWFGLPVTDIILYYTRNAYLQVVDAGGSNDNGRWRAADRDGCNDVVAVVDVVCSASDGGCGDLEDCAAVTAVDALAADRHHADTGCPGQIVRLADGEDDGGDNYEHPDADAAVLMPHTACFDIGSNRQLQDLTVSDVVPL